MSYLKTETKMVEQEVLTCSHPKVYKIWQYGGMAMSKDSSMYHCIGILFKDGEKEHREDFSSNNVEQSKEMVENFLKTLPE